MFVVQRAWFEYPQFLVETMGGAVSAGENNEELVCNLVEAEYIKTPIVEQVSSLTIVIIPSDSRLHRVVISSVDRRSRPWAVMLSWFK